MRTVYLDNGATSLPKAPGVIRAMKGAVRICGNPGRAGHPRAMAGAEVLFSCREAAASLFGCSPEQVVFTGSCTHGLNIAIHSLVGPGDRVVVSGFEHNGVIRPLWGLGADIHPAGRVLFDWEDTLEDFDRALTGDTRAAVITMASNVFGYRLPVYRLAQMCRDRGIPLILDAAQGAGTEEIRFRDLGADFIAMPGHKGLLGPMGTGLLLCREPGRPLLRGGTGSQSALYEMPDFLPDAQEPGTPNVPGIAGLEAGIRQVLALGPEKIGSREAELARRCARGLQELGYRTFQGPHQGGTFSFLPPVDCEEGAARLAREGIALRAGLHCAPLAHESAGTLETGTIRVSFGWKGNSRDIRDFLKAVSKVLPREN